ncbi:MAG: hypothetical protein EZS28_053296, partial [Streblomastix strix]
MQDFQVTESTKYRYIGIYAMMVKVSRFPLAGLCYGQKIKVSPNQIRCEAKKQICKFYHLTKKQYDTFIIDYKGFDVVEEMNKLIINDKINVNIFYYDNDDKFYYLGERKQYNKIKHIKTDDNDETEEEQSDELLPTINILLVSDINDNQAIYHVFRVTNTDGLTRQKYCP